MPRFRFHRYSTCACRAAQDCASGVCRGETCVPCTVGSDCAIGKMSVALELRRAALAAGDTAAFVPTGQTGMMIEGWGVAVDRLVADFVQGTCEWLVEAAEAAA